MNKQNKFRMPKINELLEMPKELCGNKPKITILGFDEMIIENYKGILEYEEFFLRISTYIGILNINGFNLNLNEMTEDELLVTGKITNIDLECICD